MSNYETDESISSEVLCPWCGGKPYLTRDLDVNKSYMTCLSCAACGPWSKTDKGALINWERRLHVECGRMHGPDLAKECTKYGTDMVSEMRESLHKANNAITIANAKIVMAEFVFHPFADFADTLSESAKSDHSIATHTNNRKGDICITVGDVREARLALNTIREK
jgi:hypothetical protein